MLTLLWTTLYGSANQGQLYPALVYLLWAIIAIIAHLARYWTPYTVSDLLQLVLLTLL